MQALPSKPDVIVDAPTHGARSHLFRTALMMNALIIPDYAHALCLEVLKTA